MFLRLIANRGRILRNHLRARPAWVTTVIALVSLVALIGLFLLVRRWSGVLASRADLAGSVRLWTFRLNALTMMVIGYGALNTLFRDSENRILHALPLSMGAYFWYKLYRIGSTFLIFLLLELIFPLALFTLGATAEALFAVLFFVGSYLFAVLVGGAIQVYAGWGMLSGSEKLKEILVGGVAPKESAFFYYAPAGALAAAMVNAVFLELMLKTWLFDGLVKPYLYGTALTIVLVAEVLRRSRRLFVAEFTTIIPKFNEVDITPELHEGDQQTRRYFGFQLARLFGGQAGRIFDKDWLQFRRRFRVVPALVLLFHAVWLYLCVRAGTTAWALPAALTLCLGGGLFFTPAFKLLGPEMESHWVVGSFPIRPSALGHAKWIGGLAFNLALTVPASVVYAVFSRDILGATLVLGLGFTGLALIHYLAVRLAQVAFPDVRLAAGVFYGTLIMVAMTTIAVY